MNTMNRKAEGINKDWIKPVAASFARLQNVQSQLSNTGQKRTDSSEPFATTEQRTENKHLTGQILKCTNGLENRNLSAQYVGTHKLNSSGIEFKPSYPSSSFYTWGSNTFISELIARQGKQTRKHASSGKAQISHRDDLSTKGKQPSAADLFNTGKSCNVYSKKGATVEPVGTRLLLDSRDVQSDASFDNAARPVRRPINLCLPSADVDCDNDEETTAVLPRLMLQGSVPVNRKTEDYGSAVQSSEKTSTSACRKALPQGSKKAGSPVPGGQSKNTTQLNTADISNNEHSSHNRNTTQLNTADISNNEHSSHNRNTTQLNTADISNNEHSSHNRNTTQLNTADISNNEHSSHNRKSTTQSRKHLFRFGLTSPSSESSSNTEGGFSFFNAYGDWADKRQGKGRTFPSNNISSEIQDVKCNTYDTKPISEDNAKLHSAVSHTKSNLEALPRAAVKIREDKNVIVDITPRPGERNIARKLKCTGFKKSADTLPKYESSSPHNDEVLHELEFAPKSTTKKDCSPGCNFETLCKSGSSTNFSNDKRNCGQIPIVAVDFGDERDDFKEQNNLRNKTKDSLKTVASDDSKMESYSNVFGTLHKSNREKNFYEISLSSSQRQNTLRDNAGGDRRGIPEVIKTTKTIEFNQNGLQEVASIKQLVDRKSNFLNGFGNRKYKSTAPDVCQDSGQVEQKRITEKRATEESIGLSKERRALKVIEKDKAWLGSRDNDETLMGWKVKADVPFQDVLTDQPGRGKRSEISKSTEKLFTQVYTPVRNHPAKRTVKKRISSAPKERLRPLDNEVKAYMTTDNTAKSKPPRGATNARAIQSANSATRGHIFHQSQQKSNPRKEKVKECNIERPEVTNHRVDVGVKALQSAISSKSGKSLYSQSAGFLPSDPSYGLLPHYMHWLPEEYSKLKKMELRLAEDNRLRLNKQNRISQRNRSLPILKNNKLSNRVNECTRRKDGS